MDPISKLIKLLGSAIYTRVLAMVLLVVGCVSCFFFMNLAFGILAVVNPEILTPQPTETAAPTLVPDKTYLEFRNLLLTADPSNTGISPEVDRPNVWGVVFDVGSSEGTVTLISLGDGTTSLFTSLGNGQMDFGDDKEIAERSRNLVVAAEKYIKYMKPAVSFPLPLPDNARIHALTYKGVYAADIVRYQPSDDLYAELSKLQGEIIQLIVDRNKNK